MQQGLRLKNLKFFTGLQNEEENNSVPQDKFYNIRNARLAGKVLASKPGYQIFGNALTGGTTYQALNEYEKMTAGVSAKYLVAFYNKILRVFDEPTQLWTDVATVWPNLADSFTDSVEYYNKMYFINPLTAGSTGGIGKYDGTAFAVVPNSPNGIAMESWAERIWILDPTLPVVRACRAATVANPEYIEDWVTGTIQELVGKGGHCTAIRVLDNQLYVWKEDGIWTNTIDRLANGISAFFELSRTGGAINQKSTTRVENDIWFITPNLEVRSLGVEKGFQANNNPRTRNLTEIIKRSMLLLDPIQDDPTMTYNNRLVKVHLKTRNSPTNNYTIIFDYDTGGFEIDWGQAVHIGAKFKNEIYYGEAGVSGQLYKDETGYTAGGLAFLHSADTPFMDDNRPDAYKRARYIYWRGKLSYNQSVTLKLYRGGDYTTYTSYVIPAPANDGVTQTSPGTGGQWGQAQWGADLWGGAGGSSSDITLYQREKLISVDRRSNMYALGIEAQINGGKVITEQLIVKLIDDNENYKRVNQ